MIDHVSIPVSDLPRATAFYEAVLAPLGLTCLVTREGSAGFGKRYPEFWLNLRPDTRPVPHSGAHICLRAAEPEAVRAFHRAAMEHGGADGGAPGDRKAAMTTYYAAFVVDPDGNRVEAACFPKG